MNISTKINALKHVIFGYVKKWGIDLGVLAPKKLDNRNSETIVVSLTSYGRRVNDEVVYYTLVSLLRQSVLPDRIILWLDENNWNETNLPTKLARLKKYGVEILFCRDIRSYTKLVPTLKLCPNDIIITVDDDVIYHPDLIESLLKVHYKYPNDIITRQARFPQIKNDKFIPYNKWALKVDDKMTLDYIMPIGVSGVLYPPKSLDTEVFNEEIFKKLCPIADDIWFWIMAKKIGTRHQVIAPNHSVGHAFDDLYQYFHKGSALTHSNSKQNANDTQLAAIMDYFGIKAIKLKQ